MTEYSGKTRMEMAEFTRQSRERYDRSQLPSVAEVKQRNEKIEQQRNDSGKNAR